MPKSRKLKDIKIKEVSMVDLPANKLSFLFFKRDGAGKTQFTKAEKKITIGIESNGTVGGTQITINGDKLGKLKSFDFGFYNDDPKSMIHASYSKVTGSEDGFSRTETYYLTKGVFMTKELLKALQEFLGTDEIDFEKKIDEEEILKAVTLINKEYKADLPGDLAEAVGVIVKRAADSYAVEKENADNLEKAGAKFSKDVLKKLEAVVAAVKALQAILPEAQEPTKKSESGDTKVEELTKQIAELKEVIAKGANDGLKKTLEDLKKQVETLEKGGVTKKSIGGQDNDDDDEPKGAGEDGKPLWPTLTGQKKE